MLGCWLLSQSPKICYTRTYFFDVITVEPILRYLHVFLNVLPVGVQAPIPSRYAYSTPSPEITFSTLWPGVVCSPVEYCWLSQDSTICGFPATSSICASVRSLRSLRSLTCHPGLSSQRRVRSVGSPRNLGSGDVDEISDKFDFIS